MLGWGKKRVMERFLDIFLGVVNVVLFWGIIVGYKILSEVLDVVLDEVKGGNSGLLDIVLR